VTATSSARVATERPTHYLRGLCEHFADRRQRHGDQEFEVSHDDRKGTIDFDPVIDGRCEVDARADGTLVLHASATDASALDRVQRIVGRHLERFGEEDGLTVEWKPGVP
jgi:hypothetical protein